MKEIIHIFDNKFEVQFAKDYTSNIARGGESASYTLCIIRRGSAIYTGIAILDPKDYHAKSERTAQRIAFFRACEAAIFTEGDKLPGTWSSNPLKMYREAVRYAWHEIRQARYEQRKAAQATAEAEKIEAPVEAQA